MSFWTKDGVQWVGFGAGTVAFAHSAAYPEKNGPQVEVQLRDPGEPHEISMMKTCPKETIMGYPCKVVLGFNKLESFDAFMSCLQEARDELATALATTPKGVNKDG